jgi:hypothetical protein
MGSISFLKSMESWATSTWELNTIRIAEENLKNEDMYVS